MAGTKPPYQPSADPARPLIDPAKESVGTGEVQSALATLITAFGSSNAALNQAADDDDDDQDADFMPDMTDGEDLDPAMAGEAVDPAAGLDPAAAGGGDPAAAGGGGDPMQMLMQACQMMMQALQAVGAAQGGGMQKAASVVDPAQGGAKQAIAGGAGNPSGSNWTDTFPAESNAQKAEAMAMAKSAGSLDDEDDEDDEDFAPLAKSAGSDDEIPNLGDLIGHAVAAQLTPIVDRLSALETTPGGKRSVMAKSAGGASPSDEDAPLTPREWLQLIRPSRG